MELVAIFALLLVLLGTTLLDDQSSNVILDEGDTQPSPR